MKQHPYARLAPIGRGRWTRACRPLASGSAGAGGKPLSDRPCRPLRSPTRTPDETRCLVVANRLELRASALALSTFAGVPARTCGRIVSRACCPRLSELNPATDEPVRRG